MPVESVLVEAETVEKEDEGEKREIGKLAAWTVSSNKPGNGVEMLRDNNLLTYWQLGFFSHSLLHLCFRFWDHVCVYRQASDPVCAGFAPVTEEISFGGDHSVVCEMRGHARRHPAQTLAIKWDLHLLNQFFLISYFFGFVSACNVSLGVADLMARNHTLSIFNSRRKFDYRY